MANSIFAIFFLGGGERRKCRCRCESHITLKYLYLNFANLEHLLAPLKQLYFPGDSTWQIFPLCESFINGMLTYTKEV